MLLRNLKAQTSLEYLFVLIFVLVIIAGILGAFGQINNSTAAIALIKAHTLKELNKAEEFYMIKGVNGPEFENNKAKFRIGIEGEPEFKLTSMAQTLQSELVKKIKDANLYLNVEIEFS